MSPATATPAGKPAGPDLCPTPLWKPQASVPRRRRGPKRATPPWESGHSLAPSRWRDTCLTRTLHPPIQRPTVELASQHVRAASMLRGSPATRLSRGLGTAAGCLRPPQARVFAAPARPAHGRASVSSPQASAAAGQQSLEAWLVSKGGVVDGATLHVAPGLRELRASRVGRCVRAWVAAARLSRVPAL